MAKKKKRNEQPEVKPSPIMKVQHRGYTAVQSPRNFHVMIEKNGHMVCHVHKDRLLTEAELRETVDNYLFIREEVLE